MQKLKQISIWAFTPFGLHTDLAYFTAPEAGTFVLLTVSL